jgi:cobalt/nickel transport system permease protein
LNGIVGLLLGWAAFPIILVALLLQAVLFQFGGITTLGVNTVVMALPAVACHYLFRGFMLKSQRTAAVAAFGCGFLAVLGGALLLGLALIFTEENFFNLAALVIGSHVPVMVIEGVITAFCVLFLKKVYPQLLGGLS